MAFNNQHLGFDYDPEEVTGVDHVPMSNDPLVNQGKLMAAVARQGKQITEGFAAVRQLDGRLRRIERLLYGVGGSLLLAVGEYLARALGVHGP